jgi:hypothetical protein
MKKERSKFGIISIALALLPLILWGVFILIGVLIDSDRVPETWEVFGDYLWDPMWLITFFSPLIGFFVAVVGLFQRRKSRVLPVIGVVANVLWITWLIWFIYQMKDFNINYGMGGF